MKRRWDDDDDDDGYTTWMNELLFMWHWQSTPSYRTPNALLSRMNLDFGKHESLKMRCCCYILAYIIINAMRCVPPPPRTIHIHTHIPENFDSRKTTSTTTTTARKHTVLRIWFVSSVFSSSSRDRAVSRIMRILSLQLFQCAATAAADDVDKGSISSCDSQQTEIKIV